MDNHIVGTAHQCLGLAVTVPVIEDEVELLVRTCHEVRTHVNPPQARTVHLVTLMQVKVGLIAFGIEISAVVATLHHELHLAITVNVGNGTVVERVAARDIRSVTVDDILHVDVPILVFPRSHLFRGKVVALRAIDDGHHLVLAAARTVIVLIVGDIDGFSHLCTVTIQVILSIEILRRQLTPADKDARTRHAVSAVLTRLVALWDSHETTRKLVSNTLRTCRQRHSRKQQHR